MMHHFIIWEFSYSFRSTMALEQAPHAMTGTPCQGDSAAHAKLFNSTPNARIAAVTVNPPTHPHALAPSKLPKPR